PEVDFHQSALDGQLQDALAQVTLEEFREQGQHVEAHASNCRSGRIRWSGRARYGLFTLFQILLQQHRHLFGWFGSDAEPILDALRSEPHALIRVSDHGIIRTQLFDDATIARLPRIDGHDSVVRAVLPSQHFHANTNGHEFTFRHWSLVISH